LSELAADYQDEHSTSTQTAEMLETETAERFRLDKECKELQVGDLQQQMSFYLRDAMLSWVDR